jgi:hypothetical protein
VRRPVCDAGLHGEEIAAADLVQWQAMEGTFGFEKGFALEMEKWFE